MFTIFLDESANGGLASVAGYLIGSDRLKDFDSVWGAMLKSHSIPYIHMKEMTPKGAMWLGDQKNKAIFRSAVSVIREFAACGVAVAIDRKLYIETVPQSPGAVTVISMPSPQTLRTSPYRLKRAVISSNAVLFGACIHLANTWLKHSGHSGELIVPILSKGGDYTKQAQAIVADMNNFDWELHYNVSEVETASYKEKMPLQAADIIAVEARKEFKRRWSKGTFEPPSQRKLLASLLGDSVPHVGILLSDYFTNAIAHGIHPVDLFRKLSPAWE